MKVIDSVVIALEAEAENDLVRRVVPWRRYGHRLMVRNRLELLLRLWPVALVILNFVVLTGVVREHGFEDKHLLDIVNDLLERDFLVSGLFLIPLLVASVPLFLFFRLQHLVVALLIVRVVHEALELLVYIGERIAEALVCDYVSAPNRSVLLLFSNDGFVHLTGCVVVGFQHLRVLDHGVVLRFLLGTFQVLLEGLQVLD